MTIAANLSHDEARDDLGLSNSICNFKARISPPFVEIYASGRNEDLRPAILPHFRNMVHLDVFAPEADDLISGFEKSITPWRNHWGLYTGCTQPLLFILRDMRHIALAANELTARVYSNARPPGNPEGVSVERSKAMHRIAREHARGLFINADITVKGLKSIIALLSWSPISQGHQS